MITTGLLFILINTFLQISKMDDWQPLSVRQSFSTDAQVNARTVQLFTFWVSND